MHQQQQTSTGKPIPKEELWASMSAANQAGKPVAQAPIEAHEATGITESTEQVPVNNTPTSNTGRASIERVEVANITKPSPPSVAASTYRIDKAQPLDAAFPDLGPRGLICSSRDLI